MSGIADLVYVDETGFHFPDFPTVLAHMQETYRSIYGADVYLEADSQDGQWVAVIAMAVYDCMQVAASVYASFSPLSAQGDALSRNVKINGIHRRLPTHSTVELLITGDPGTTITNGQAQDITEQKWNLPPVVTIPEGGEITVTASAAEYGFLQAQAGTITKIATPTRGWLSVTNPDAAVTGVAVETDAELRRRQAQSTMLASQTPLDGIVGGILALPDVKRAKGYENDGVQTDANGIPRHHIAIVVEGGNINDIANTIMRKKTLGAGTHGSIEVMTYDAYGVEKLIRFYRPTLVNIFVEIELEMRSGYISSTAEKIKSEVARFISEQDIGDDIYITKLYVPACLSNDTELRDTFDIRSIKIKREGGAWSESNVALRFTEAAACTAANVAVKLL